MSLPYEPNFQALETNIIEIIKEEQIKLGYHSETIRLYYPMESINHILGTELGIDELSVVLDEFSSFVKERLGEVTHSNRETRFCMLIPPQGVTYVHEKVEDRPFLREFINKISGHPDSIDDILEVFYRYSKYVKCEEVTNGEFDYLVYFEEGQPDEFLYCIKMEGGHAIYHRYTKDDYESFGF